MRLFSRTTDAEEVLRDGFRDSPRYLVDRAASGVWLSYRPMGVEDGADPREYSGVWLSDVPLAISDEAPGDDLVVDIPESEVKPFEWAAEAQTCRGFFVPAEILNRFPVQLPTDDDRAVRAHEGADPTDMIADHERLRRQAPPGAGRSTG